MNCKSVVLNATMCNYRLMYDSTIRDNLYPKVLETSTIVHHVYRGLYGPIYSSIGPLYTNLFTVVHLGYCFRFLRSEKDELEARINHLGPEHKKMKEEYDDLVEAVTKCACKIFNRKQVIIIY